MTLVLLLWAGCSSDDHGGGGSGFGQGPAGAVSDADLVTAGRLTTCTHVPFPPFESAADGRVQGFDIALTDRIAGELGVPQSVRDAPLEDFQSGALLDARQCDLAAAALPITPERAAHADFSQPYFNATQAVLTRKKSGVAAMGDLKTKAKLGAQSQTGGEEYAQGQGYDPASFATSPEVLQALRSGYVQAVIIDYPVARGWLSDPANGRDFRILDQVDTGEQYGFMVRKGNTKLLAAVDQALENVEADGTYEELYKEWIGPYTSVAALPSAPPTVP